MKTQPCQMHKLCISWTLWWARARVWRHLIPFLYTYVGTHCAVDCNRMQDRTVQKSHALGLMAQPRSLDQNVRGTAVRGLCTHSRRAYVDAVTCVSIQAQA